jgi:16S rRNA processing protein RimM
MARDDFYYLGKVLKTFGNKGQVMVNLDVDDPEDYLEMESVFLDLEGERVPFFIETLELKNKRKAIIRFQDVTTLEDAEVYIGREMYLPVSILPPLKGDQFYFHEVIGFKVLDSRHGDIGILVDILPLPHQSLLQITKGKREILIPLVDEIIQQVDRNTKTIFIIAPEGLIEIYC